MSEVPRVTTTVAPAVVAGPAAPPTRTQRALTQDVVRAVRRLNEVDYAGQGREITFSIDRATRLPVVKVINTDTKEVVDQWPAQYVLQLAADYATNKRDSG